MSEAILAYRYVAASPELQEAERMRSKARHDEAKHYEMQSDSVTSIGRSLLRIRTQKSRVYEHSLIRSY